MMLRKTQQSKKDGINNNLLDEFVFFFSFKEIICIIQTLESTRNFQSSQT